jgi:hypothetical protein
MKTLTRIAFVVLLAGCATGAPTVQSAYVWPTNGQGPERTSQDKTGCYRIAQGLDGGTLPSGSADTATAYAIGGMAAGAVAYELELARRYPPDLSKYGACLTARGYSVDWPKGKQP